MARWCVSVCLCVVLWAGWLGCNPDGPAQETPGKEEPSKDASVKGEGRVADILAQDVAPPELRGKPDGPLKETFGGKRPVTIRLPEGFEYQRRYPLLVVLHGYGATGQLQSFYLGVKPLADREGILLLAPDGTKDPSGKQFWNATDNCCDFSKSGVDDAGYIRGLIEDVKKHYNIGSVFLIGHSNGGYMSFRMACDAADLITGIASLAGATFLKREDCKPSGPVSILQIHGTEDDSVKYEGDTGRRNYPGAVKTAEYWGAYNKCTGALQPPSKNLDVDKNIDGKETDVRVFGGCPEGVDLRLWSIQKGGHLPAITPDFPALVWDWMKQQKKP